MGGDCGMAAAVSLAAACWAAAFAFASGGVRSAEEDRQQRKGASAELGLHDVSDCCPFL